MVYCAISGVRFPCLPSVYNTKSQSSFNGDPLCRKGLSFFSKKDPSSCNSPFYFSAKGFAFYFSIYIYKWFWFLINDFVCSEDACWKVFLRFWFPKFSCYYFYCHNNNHTDTWESPCPPRWQRFRRSSGLSFPCPRAAYYFYDASCWFSV